MVSGFTEPSKKFPYYGEAAIDGPKMKGIFIVKSVLQEVGLTLSKSEFN